MTKKAHVRSNLKSIAAIEDQNTPKLGYVLWWTIERDLLADGKKAKTAFLKNGFLESEIPSPLGYEEALVRAVRKSTMRKELNGWLIRRISQDVGRILYGIVEEKVDQTKEDLTYQKEDKLTLFLQSGTLSLENQIPEAKVVYEIYQNHKGKIDNWKLSSFLVQQLKNMNALPLREMGGVYFIPIAYQEKLLSIEKGLSEVSPGTILYLLPIYKDTKSQKSLKTAFNENFRQELTKLAEELKTRIETEGTRSCTFKNRLREYKELRERAKVYEDLLQYKALDIRESINALEKQVTKALESME